MKCHPTPAPIRLAAIFDGGRNVPETRLDEAKNALAELVRFRKDHQDTYFSDLLRVTNFWERPRWNVDGLVELIERN